MQSLKSKPAAKVQGKKGPSNAGNLPGKFLSSKGAPTAGGKGPAAAEKILN